MEIIYGRLHHLLSRYNHNLLSPKKSLQKDPNYREKTSKTSARPAVLRRRQIADTNVVDFDETSVSSLTSMRSRHVTKSNGVVQPKSSIRKLPIGQDGGRACAFPSQWRPNNVSSSSSRSSSSGSSGSGSSSISSTCSSRSKSSSSRNSSSSSSSS